MGQKDKGKEQWCELGSSPILAQEKTLFNGCIWLHDIKCFMFESYRTFLTEFLSLF